LLIFVRVLALGWVSSADLGPTHGEWACLVEWSSHGEGPWI
jgi:hypothetical protein